MLRQGPLLLVGLLGCEAQLELPPVIEASEHLVLRGEEEVCAGTFDEMEARVVAIQEIFHVPAVRVEYNWLPYRFPEAECVIGATACTRGHDVFAEELGDEHELVHASRVDFTLPAPLEEGLAAFLGSSEMAMGTRKDLRLAIETDDEFSYTRASEFVQFLVPMGGFDGLRELAKRTEYQMPFAEWRPEFEDVYGQSWEAVWDAYLASPECDRATMSDDVLLCYSGVVAQENLTPGLMETREYTYEMSCNDPFVVGPVEGGELRHEVLVRFEETSIQTVVVGLHGDVVEGSYAKLTRCGSCSGEDGVVLTKESSVDWFSFEPGLYVLDLRQPMAAPGVLGIHVHF